MIQQSIDLARHTVGSAQPLAGEIVPATERVTVPQSAPTSPAVSRPAPAVEVIPAPAPATSPTSWEWTAGPDPIDITIPAAPAAPATWKIEKGGLGGPRIPASILLSMGATMSGVGWAAMTSTKAHPADPAAVILAALGIVALIVTTLVEYRKGVR